ncbi:MAG: AmmeMemoRadiSam system protein B [Candidatus Omnitrophota bacterium]
MAASKIRKAAVAGKFYPSSAGELKKQIKDLIGKETDKTDVIACMLPHAGYMYSGSVVAGVLSSVNIKERIVLLGPNHTGFGAPFSIMTEGIWQTPLGKVKIDSDLAKQLLRGSKYLEDDSAAHIYEHSLEVQLPFLQYLKTDFKIVPIVFLSDGIEALKEIGEEIAGVLKGLKGSAMILASSDMTHYEPQEAARNKDKEAIEAILALDEDRLLERVRQLGISMCGYAPVIVMLRAAKMLGARFASLVKYQTSGDISGELDSVVGYAGITIY